MNKKLIITLRYKYSKQGFALPVALGLGLVMILIGATMIARAQSDLVTASFQRDIAQSLSLSEVGVTRTQALLKQNSGVQLAKKKYIPGTPGTNEWAGNPGVSDILGDPNMDGWISVSTVSLPLTSVVGHFKIVRYEHNSSAGVGSLKVLGTTEQNINKLKLPRTTQRAISSLEVQIDDTEFRVISWQQQQQETPQ